MTSDRKIEANRRNAQKSSGPRTPVGKARVKLNAVKHGLNSIARSNPVYSSEIERNAKAMCEDIVDPQMFEEALVIAENDLILRFMHAEFVAESERRREAMATPFEIRLTKLNMPGAEREHIEELRETMPYIDRLVRYQRRAWSRRARALRKFTKIKSRLVRQSKATILSTVKTALTESQVETNRTTDAPPLA